MIVANDALILGQYPHLVYCFTTSFVVRIKAGKAVIGNIMQPKLGSSNIDAGFVAMNQWR